MKTEIAANLPQKKKKSKLLLIMLIFTGVMLLSTVVLAYITLRYDCAYRGVYVGSLDVSGMSRTEIFEQLESMYTIPASGLEITLKTDLAELKASYPDLGVIYDIDAAADKAFSIGRRGSIFERLYDIARAAVSGISVGVQQSYDESKIDEFVSDFSEMAFQQVMEGALLISDENIVIKSGRHGEAVDKAEVKSLVIDMIKNGRGEVIRPNVIITETTRFNASDVYDSIVCSPENAYYKMENDSLVLVPHKMGRTIDRAELEQIIAEHNTTENTEHLLPVSYVMPEVTSGAAVSMLFRDELARYSTPFETRTQNEKNRMHNIALASSKYHNYILMPGEEFSFNKVVGSRNEKTGYKSAHVFINGRVEDGIGGGICQAVSTLYNAVLLSDLEVVERKNHSFIVTYVPLGQDATAYYGGTDLRFINNTGWPIKILSWVEDNQVHVVFMGTNTNPEKTVIISTKTLSRTRYKTKYVDDPTLPVGTVKKSQYGTDGYVVETYKTVKIGGKVVSQAKLHTSRYNACNEEFLVGILRPDGTLAKGLAAQMANKAASPAPTNTDAANTPETSGNDQEPAGTPANDTSIREPSGDATNTGGSSGTDADIPGTSGSDPDMPGTSDDGPGIPGPSEDSSDTVVPSGDTTVPSGDATEPSGGTQDQ